MRNAYSDKPSDLWIIKRLMGLIERNKYKKVDISNLLNNIFEELLEIGFNRVPKE